MSAQIAPASPGTPLPWRLEDIDLSAIDVQRVRDDETLFYLVVTSSFVEIASELYARNLSTYYAGDAQVLAWLTGNWEQEEVQHGRALRAYVQAVWPEFDWETANAAFYAEYAARCTLDEFEPTRALELAARCMVETGTAVFYRMLHDYTDEPVLKRITGHIKADEVRHYSYFWRFFQLYRSRDGASRWKVARAVLRRVAEARNDDGLIAFRHAWRGRNPGRAFEPREYATFQKRMRAILRRHFPVEMAVRMLIRPIDLPPALTRVLVPVLTRTAGMVLI